MPHIAFWIAHASRQPEKLRTLAELLCEPVFDKFNRTAMIDRDRRVGRTAKSPEKIAQQLLADKSQGVDLENRGREPDAAAFFVFDGDQREGAYPAPHRGNIQLPYDADKLDDYVDVFTRIVRELYGTLAYISLEPTFGEAHSVTLGQDNRRTRSRTDISDQRRRERKAQAFHRRQYPTRIPSVHWGIYLSAGHLATVGLDTLQAAACFYRVQDLGDGQVFLQLTADPMDALGPAYDQLLDGAREALTPLRIDVSDIELTPRGD